MSAPGSRVLAARLHNQLLAGAQPRRAADVVARLCAMQAQDYIGARWAIGLRAARLDDAAVESAFNAGAILRTHVLRPTWHFVTPADIGWMLSLTAPRVHQASAFYYRQHGLDARTLTRAHRVLVSELAGGRFRTRTELAAALARRGVEARGPRLGLLTIHAELEQVMCSGPARGKQLTYALFDERAPSSAARRPRDPGADLASRYFASHGPATLRDFVWWSGLTVAHGAAGRSSQRLPRSCRAIIDGSRSGRRAGRPRPVAPAGRDVLAAELRRVPDRRTRIASSCSRAPAWTAMASSRAPTPLPTRWSWTVWWRVLASPRRRREDGGGDRAEDAAHHAPAPRGEGRRRASRHVFRAGAIDGRAGLKAGPRERMLALTDRTALSAVLPA